MKLKDIILDEAKGFTLTDKEIDPETGAITHKVTYEPIVDLRREVEELNSAFKKTLQQYPEDQKLEQFYEVYASFKRKFKTHVNRKYGR